MKRRLTVGGFILSDFKAYYQDKLYWCKYRHTDLKKQNREPSNKPTHIQSIIFNKGPMPTEWEKYNFFNKWGYWISKCQANKQKAPQRLPPTTYKN